MSSQRTLLVVVLCTSCFFASMDLGDNVQAAEKYPAKAVTLLIPLEAGSDGDIIIRPLCQRASTLLGQSVIVLNKPGAGSTIGYREIYTAKPDGYTIGCGFATLLTNKMQGLMPLEFADYTIISSVYYQSQIVVASTKTQRPFKTMQEVLSYAKSNPGKISIATGSVGQGLWVATMVLVTGTGLEFNLIPQPGAAGFIIAQVAGGHTDLGVVNLSSAKPQIEAGNVRFLAVIGPERVPAPYDNVPTMKELGYDLRYESFGIIIGPPKVPQDARDKLSKAFVTGANDPDYQKFLAERNCIPFPSPPDQARAFINERRIFNRMIMEKAGILKEK